MSYPAYLFTYTATEVRKPRNGPGPTVPDALQTTQWRTNAHPEGLPLK